jgi:hypothetical protein
MAAIRPATPAARSSRTAARKGAAQRAATVQAADAAADAAASTKADKAMPDADVKAKPKLVRDSFTIPKNEYGVLAELKQRSARLGHPAKKSEVLRAGIAALKSMPDAALLAALQAVPSLKTGRPKNNGKR